MCALRATTPARITDPTGSDTGAAPSRYNDKGGVKVTQRSCLIIPVGLAGLAVTWLAAIVLIGVRTFGGPEVTGVWGLLCSAAAAAWTVLYGLTRHYERMADAFTLGRESVRRLHKEPGHGV